MKASAIAIVTALVLSIPGGAMAQDANAKAPAEVSCADILNTPGASVEQIAALNDTTSVTVLRCKDADAAPLPASADVTSLRSAISSNPALATRFTAAGATPEQVVAVRAGDNGTFNFYVIGAFR